MQHARQVTISIPHSESQEEVGLATAWVLWVFIIVHPSVAVMMALLCQQCTYWREDGSKAEEYRLVPQCMDHPSARKRVTIKSEHGTFEYGS